jgi:hypothetical protein
MVKVMTPTNPTERQKELLREFEAASTEFVPWDQVISN